MVVFVTPLILDLPYLYGRTLMNLHGRLDEFCDVVATSHDTTFSQPS